MFATHRWNALPNIWTEMSRLHDEFTRNRHGEWGNSKLRVNAWQDGDKLVLEAELPGISGEDIDLSVEGNALTLKVDVKETGDVEGKWLRRERTYGEFERTFQLPFEVERDRVEAALTDGMLVIELPKREEDKARRIDIKVNE